MEPLSLAATVIGLAQTGVSIGAIILSVCESYRDAPEEIVHIGDEITICSHLMRPFGEQLNRRSAGFKVEFSNEVERLVQNSETIFIKIRNLVGEKGKVKDGKLPRWKYAIYDKGRVEKHKTRLREIQWMFMFMKAMLSEAPAFDRPLNASGGDLSRDPSKTAVPITLTGTGIDSSGTPVVYSATLVMQPMTAAKPERESRMVMEAEVKSKPRRRADLKEELGALRQSPYFSLDLLGDMDEDEGYTRTRIRTSEVETLEILDSDAAKEDVRRLAARWFGADEEDIPFRPAPTTKSDRSDSDDDRAPAPPAYSSTTPPRDQQAPKPKGYYSSSSGRVTCDGCGDKIKRNRYKCTACKNYDLCRNCFEDGEITLRHEHVTSLFDLLQ